MTTAYFDSIQAKEVIIEELDVQKLDVGNLQFKSPTVSSIVLGDDLLVLGSIKLTDGQILQNPLISNNELGDSTFTSLEVEDLNVIGTQTIQNTSVQNCIVNKNIVAQNLTTPQMDTTSLKASAFNCDTINVSSISGTLNGNVLNLDSCVAKSLKNSNLLSVTGNLIVYDTMQCQSISMGSNVLSQSKTTVTNTLRSTTMDDVNVSQLTSKQDSYSNTSSTGSLLTNSFQTDHLQTNHLNANSASFPTISNCTSIPSSVQIYSLSTPSISSKSLSCSEVFVNNGTVTLSPNSSIQQTNTSTNRLNQTQINGSLTSTSPVYVNNTGYGYQFSDGSTQYTAWNFSTPSLAPITSKTFKNADLLLVENTPKNLISIPNALQPSKKYYIQAHVIIYPAIDVISTMIFTLHGSSKTITKLNNKPLSVVLSTTYTPTILESAVFTIQGVEGTNTIYSTVEERYIFYYEVK